MMTMMIKLLKSVQLLLFQLVIIIGGQQGGNSGRGRSMRTKPIFASDNFSLLDNNIPSCQAAAHIES
jgi:hypothetical protein